MYIYCGYPEISSAETVVRVCNAGISPKPSGGYISISEALDNYPIGYCILRIEVSDNAEVDQTLASFCTDTWKIYRQEDIIGFEIL